MPIMKRKSEENIKAARILSSDENECYAASVHCAYYSCFQLSKYVLSDCFKLNYQEQNKLTDNKGSHKIIIKELSTELKRINVFYQTDYSRSMNKLKKLRRKSDYDDEFILKEEAQCAILCADEIFKVLSKKMTI